MWITDAFEIASMLKYDLDSMSSQQILQTMVTTREPRCVFITTKSTTSERKLITGLQIARDTYSVFEVNGVALIRSEFSVSDDFKK